VTHYEKVTRGEIARRNYREGTTRAYLRVLHDLAGYSQQPPERLTSDQIRQHSAQLITDRKLSGNTVNQMVGALRFFYLTVLNRPWRSHQLPYPKKSVRLPVIWSPEEIASLIDAAPTPFYRTILMTLYATGMRRAEVAALKITDVCSHCGYQAISFNSCRNRHCPKRQSNARDRWLEARRRELLPVRYAHVVFTLPGELAPLALQTRSQPRIPGKVRARTAGTTRPGLPAPPDWV
jgi:site-specific recombinase XerD